MSNSKPATAPDAGHSPWSSAVRAASHGDAHTLDSLLSASPELVHHADPHGDRLVHFAARGARRDCLKVLIDNYGADANVANRFGRRPLHESIEHPESVEYLLDHGADPNGFKHGTWTPLMIAAHKNLLPVVNLLHSHGALLTPVNKDGWTALHLAAQAASIPCIEYILSHAPELSLVQTKNGRTPAMIAAAHGAPDALRILLNVAREVSAAGAGPPIVAPAEGASTQHKGDPVEAKNEEGMTALHFACVAGDVDCVDLLLCHFGADPRAVDKAGRGAVHHAAMAGRTNVLERLFQWFRAEMRKEGGGAEDAGETPKRIKEEMEMSDGWEGFTPLHWAAREGHLDVARWLIQMQVDAGKKDSKGRTPADLANAWNRGEVADLLMSQ
ncbi:Ankyrin repeat domain-containing protein 16 [Borealophlyctis nickersoniae]|nr:Ankyrin repeat domain-containing protein 16 [Borealophlyctis nickersoniae]